MIASLTKHSKQLSEVLPKIEDGIAKAAKVLEAKTNKALQDYQGELAGFGVSNLPKKAKTLELDAPKGNELKGAQTKRLDLPSRKTPDDFTEFKSMNHKKAAAGEYNAHQLMGEKGYTPLGRTDGNYKPGETGIDGIYNHPNPPPDFVITEAKYNTARLGKTKDGKQMSNDWITDKRLKKAGLSKKDQRKVLKALENNDGTVQKLLIRNKEDGSLVVKELDESAKIIGKAIEL
ncbi:hypothetical protein [Litorilituus sediminis]|uniref:hypothetical protein n=1 Tax=Litorilituus sediminis TaxID=718192 RepID=UPI001B85C695|nr:hypothetical protein [Litorilituus sediminis]